MASQQSSSFLAVDHSEFRKEFYRVMEPIYCVFTDPPMSASFSSEIAARILSFPSEGNVSCGLGRISTFAKNVTNDAEPLGLG